MELDVAHVDTDVDVDVAAVGVDAGRAVVRCACDKCELSLRHRITRKHQRYWVYQANTTVEAEKQEAKT